MKIRNMGQNMSPPKPETWHGPCLSGTAVPPFRVFFCCFLLSGQATYLPTSDLKARGFLWSILLLYFLGLKSL